jgi:Htaa
MIRALARPVLALAGAALLLAVLAPRAGATVTPIATGTLDWGVKESFRNYITGPIAHGSIELGDGATANPDGTYRFPLTAGSYDDETGSTVASFGGWVRFRGHDGQLDLTISGLRVELTGDGPRVLADMSSVPYPAGGAPTTYADTEVVSLDLSAVDPAIAGGTTTWTGIPSALTAAGAPAFGGFYTKGTPFDPVTLTYTGPGGKPVDEGWSEPGAPFFGPVGETQSLGGIYHLFVDPGHELLHVVSASGVNAYDLDTLEPRASHTVTDLEQFGIAFDPETATVFVRRATGDVLSFRYDDGAYVEGTVPLTAARTLDYDPATDKLWAIGTFAPAPTFQGNPTVAVATRNGSGWTAESYPPIDTGGRNISGMARSSTGTLIGTYAALLVSGRPQPQSAAVFEDTGSALVPTDVPGTVATAPPSGMSTGYGNPSAATGGGVLLAETAFAGASPRVLTLEPSDADPTGYAVAGEPFFTGPGLSVAARDRTDGTVYTQESGSIGVYRGGERIAAIDAASVVDVAGGDASLYAGSNATGKVTRYRQLGNSPAVTKDPEEAAVELPAADGTRPVTFSAAADGTPAPAVRWQRRAPGETRWSAIDGATADTLTVDATIALAGTRYRAVFESVAGAIASRAATLSVTVAPPAGSDPPAGGQPGGGSTGADQASGEGPAAKPARLAVRRGRVRVGARRVARVATVRCVAGPCRVSAPRRVRLGRRAFRARVLKPARLQSGQRGAVRLKLPRAATRALAGRAAKVRLRVTVRSGTERVSEVVRVTLTFKKMNAR